MELDFIDISKADEEGQARFSGPGAGQTSKSKAKINRSVFLDINEEQGENAVYESGGGEISAGVSPVRRKVQNPGRTVVNIDVSRPQSRERRGAEERSRAQNTPGNRGRNGENTRRARGGNSGRKRERYSRERDEGADRERMPAKRRNPRQNAGERRRDAGAGTKTPAQAASADGRKVYGARIYGGICQYAAVCFYKAGKRRAGKRGDGKTDRKQFYGKGRQKRSD